MKRLWLTSFILLFFVIPCANGKTTVVNDSNLLEIAQALPQTGTLKNDHGYIYLKVSDDFRNKLFPLLIKNLTTKNVVCLKPSSNKVGAHISLFYNGELSKQEIHQLPLEQVFTFQVTNIAKVKLKKHQRGKILYQTWYVAEIDSPALNTLIRQNKFFAFHQQPLHISFALARYWPDGSCAIPTKAKQFL